VPEPGAHERSAAGGAPDAIAELQAWSLGPIGYPCHQFVVDATAARWEAPTDPPIRLAFALVGICLRVERGFDGPTIQRAHQRMASPRRDWPRFAVAPATGRLGPDRIVALAESERPAAIDAWLEEVWADYADVHDEVRALVVAPS